MLLLLPARSWIMSLDSSAANSRPEPPLLDPAHAPFPLGSEIHGITPQEKSLSVAYVCPFWPPASGAHGVVMYVDAITKGLQARGHRTTLLAHRVAGGTTRDGIYDLSEYPPPRTLTS